jgi:hypothetical protein
LWSWCGKFPSYHPSSSPQTRISLLTNACASGNVIFGAVMSDPFSACRSSCAESVNLPISYLESQPFRTIPFFPPFPFLMHSHTLYKPGNVSPSSPKCLSAFEKGPFLFRYFLRFLAKRGNRGWRGDLNAIFEPPYS